MGLGHQHGTGVSMFISVSFPIRILIIMTFTTSLSLCRFPLLTGSLVYFMRVLRLLGFQMRSNIAVFIFISASAC